MDILKQSSLQSAVQCFFIDFWPSVRQVSALRDIAMLQLTYTLTVGQAFHVCALGDMDGGLLTYSFLCPNGTIFNQEYFICDW